MTRLRLGVASFPCVVEDQPLHQIRQRLAGLHGQGPPLRPLRHAVAARLPEQIELLRPPPMLMTKIVLASHGPLSDSGRERLSLRPNPGHSMTRGRQRRQCRTLRSAGPATPAVRQHPPAGPPQPALGRRQPDPTSTPAVPATGPKGRRRGCSERHRQPPSQQPRECEQDTQTTGATDKEPRAPQSGGCSVVVLYNSRRPHSSLDRKPRMPSISTSRHFPWQLNRGRCSTYRTGIPVQTIQARSECAKSSAHYS